ncbi:MAG: DEAD/DEAH box helicase [Thermoleophilaceae bacterium]|nr:DEAD/DEAH box helicase [Thermoleophilaceae bacterium]
MKAGRLQAANPIDRFATGDRDLRRGRAAGAEPPLCGLDAQPPPGVLHSLIVSVSSPDREEALAAPQVRLAPNPRGGLALVFRFAYDELLNAAVKRLPGRRFDWDTREWIVPARPEFAEEISDLLAVFPRIEVAPEVSAWLSEVGWRGVGSVRDVGYGPVLAVRSLAGTVPEWLERRGADGGDGRVELPLDDEVAALAAGHDGLELDWVAEAAVEAVLAGAPPPTALLDLGADEEGVERFELTVDTRVDAAEAFLRLTEARRALERHGLFALAEQRHVLAVPADAALLDELDDFLDGHEYVEVSAEAEARRRELRSERRRAKETVALSVADDAELELPSLAGELRPFQRAGVRYALAQRRTFIADEQGLGKTVQALAAIEADDAYPAVVVCPASLKLNWEREAGRWLPHRRTAVLHGRSQARFARAGAAHADIVILNYEIVDGHLDALVALEPRALVFDESHYCKQPRAKRTKACLSLSARVPQSALRLALTGTPILNRPGELVAQLRLIGRLSDFESGAGMARRFRGREALERLHWHLRSRCYVRRLKEDVLPQLPPKRQVPIPVELSNEAEYRLAERDVIAWLRSQPLDLRTLEAKVGAALRNERLVQLNHLRRLAGRGKLAAALAWIEDFLASGEPLVVFADHIEIQQELLARFPDAAHILGGDSVSARDAAVAEFQRPDGPQLIVCSLRAAGQGLTLTRASNVAFLELDWTPARLAQAEDRCHRIGQASAVTAWYLLAPGTIDETMADLLEHKRGVIGAVTDGELVEGESLIDAVVRALRERGLEDERAA